MNKISYAQNYEDALLWRALEGVKNGFYIDVGTCDPVADSVTKIFYDAGWDGINIEPMPESFDRISNARQRDKNLNYGVSCKTGDITFYRIDEGNGLTTTYLPYAEHWKRQGKAVEEVVIKVETLAEICEKHVNGDIHFLKIDVEGAEKEVIEGADLKNFRPWIILAEAGNNGNPMYLDWEPLLLDANYTFVFYDGLNRYYVANEKLEELKHHFNRPINLFDDFVKHKEYLLEEEVEHLKGELEKKIRESQPMTCRKNDFSDVSVFQFLRCKTRPFRYRIKSMFK